MEALLALLIFGAIAWAWSANLRAREQALWRGQRACKALEAQFLDQTVALKRLGMRRGADGRMHLLRGYGFEFSLHGTDRRHGLVLLLGRAVEHVEMDHPDGRVLFQAGEETPVRTASVHRIH
jgi:hypothetical protein